jgi:hypothetical protein
MPKLSFALSILVLPFAFHSIQAQGQPQRTETKAGTATVSGRVTLKGEPARGVMVILQGRNPGQANSPRARTDENGRFRFNGVDAGNYSIYALAPGYIRLQETSLGLGDKTLNLAEGDKVENVDLEIRRGGVIAGRITDSQGRPVIEETINLSKRDSDNRAQFSFSLSQNKDMKRTDDRGVYRIYGLPTGRYLVSVGDAPSSGRPGITSSRAFYPRVFYPNATSESEAKLIEVSEGSEATDLDMTVPEPKETRDVSGRVVDAGTGQPVAGVEVVVGGVWDDGRSSGNSASAEVWTGPTGEFRMFGVLPGKYELFVRVEEGGGFVSDRVIFDISEGDAHGIELKVRQGASISGVVVIEGTNDPNVLAKLSQVSVGAEIDLANPNLPSPVESGRFRVNADGRFRISGLQAGKAMIMMDLPKGLADRIEHNGAPVDGEGIEIRAGEHVTGIRVVLVPIDCTLTLRGEMKIVGAALPAGFRFFVIARVTDQNDYCSHTAVTDSRGRFVIENLAQGAYEIGVTPIPPAGVELSSDIRQRFSSVKEKVFVGSDNQKPATLVVDLSRKEGDR